MCGIAGIIAWTPQDGAKLRESIRRMQQIQWQRGPDAGGTAFLDHGGNWLDETDPDTMYKVTGQEFSHDNTSFYLNDIRIALGHRRLSIQDVSEKAHQPMADASGRYRLIFNGEVFNFQELRAEMESVGQVFRSRSDTEVLLYGLIREGAGFLSRINGFFAGCFVDTQEGTCILFRDRPGVKPLFLLRENGRLSFASSTAALRSLKSGCTIRKEQLAAYLVYGQTFTEHGQTWFEEISELLPGNYLIINAKTGEESKGEIPISDTRYSDADSCLEHSLRQRLVADVPLGFAASGGLDSSLLLGMTAAIEPEQIHKRMAFSSVSNDAYADETPWQEIATRHTGVQRTACLVNKGGTPALQALMQAADMPAAGWNNLAHAELCRIARKHGIKVMINGQGADELFAGYHAYLPIWWREAGWHERLAALKNIRHSGLSLSAALKLLFRNAAQRRMGTARWQKAALNRKSFARLITPRLTACLPAFTGPEDKLNQALQADFYGQKLGQMLQWEDRNSMAAGLESRNPFADDRELAALAWSIPASEKIFKGWTKHPLRLVAAKYLPAALAWRKDKKGFTVADRRFTLQAWPELKTWLHDVPENWINKEVLNAVIVSPETCDDAMLAFLFRLACASRFIQLTQSRWP